MSAPPPYGQPNGQKASDGQQRKPNGPIRRKQQANPFVARARTLPPQIFKRPPKDFKAEKQAQVDKEVRDDDWKDEPKVIALLEKRKQNGGWSKPAPMNCSEFPLITTKRDIVESVRHHIMRFNTTKSGQDIDPTNHKRFARPVSLHRRDPRLPPVGRMHLKEESLLPNPDGDDADAERARLLKEAKEAERAIDQAQIAPSLKPNDPRPKQNKQKQKIDSFYSKNSDEQKKQSGVRYEETLPWHLEDADGKNVWVANYIAGLSEISCAFVIDGPGFRMVPLERYYQFNEKHPFQKLSLEEAEKLMKERQGNVGRWVMADKVKSEADKEKEEYRTYLSGRPRVKKESATSQRAPRADRADDRDLDVSGDEFQDDDETAGFEADDEDTKEAKERVRREHLQSNLFGHGEEDKVDEEERELRLEKQRTKVQGKQTKQNLLEREHALDYADDSDSENGDNNPFTDSSDSEGEKDEEKKDDEEAKGDSQVATAPNAKGPSGSKKPEANRKVKSLKRAASPHSESSGDDVSRKKMKTAGLAKGASSKLPSRSNSPVPRSKNGTMSDADGEGSDGGTKPKKMKAQVQGTDTPAGSRAGSPAPAAANNPASPAKSPGLRYGPLPTAEEIDLLLRQQNGIKITALLEKFGDRIGERIDWGQMPRTEWIGLVRSVALYSADKLLRPRPM